MSQIARFEPLLPDINSIIGSIGEIMELTLTRKWLTDKSTIGELAVNGKFECFILEDHFPTPYVKVDGQTCIPLGRYEVIINHSQRFNMDMPLLLGIPGFAGVRIHPGNTAAD